MPSHRRPPPPFTRIIDTGTSHHNLALGNGNPKDYIPYATNAPQLMIPNGTNITAHARYNLQLPHVSKQASDADILPTFKHSLISLANYATTTAPPHFPNTGVQFTTKTTNRSSLVLEIQTLDYTNRK